MAKDKYRILRRELKKNDIDMQYLSTITGTSTRALYSRMSGAAPWRQNEMYAIMDALHIPYDQLNVVFPPGGMYAGEIEIKTTMTAQERLCEALEDFVNEASKNDGHLKIVDNVSKSTRGRQGRSA